jgi:PAS domain S-box-containing protein
MKDQSKTKQVLIQEMASLRQRIEELEQSESVRKREEETLRENEDKYRIIFESINDAVFVHDLDEEGLPGRFLQVNDVACHRLGYTREELLTLTPRDITVPEEYERIAGKRIGLASQGNILVETIHLTKNGRKIPVESNIRQFQYLDRQAALSISRDLTERKQAEHREKLAREVLELLNRPEGSTDIVRDILQLIKKNTGFEAVGIRLQEGDDFPYYETSGFPGDFIQAERYLCARDEEGKIIRDGQGNPVVECMCGNILRNRTDPTLTFFTEAGSFWSNCTTELLASTTEEDRQARTRNRCNGEGYESVALIPLRSGDEIIGLLQLNDRRRNQFTLEMIRFLEGLGASIGIALSRKRAEKDLRESEEKYRAIIENMQEGYHEVDLKGNFTFFNESMCKILGHEREELLGMNNRQYADEENNRKVYQVYNRVYRTGEPVKNFEWQIIRKDGSRRDIEVSISLIKDAEGHPTGFRGIVRDTTERKRAEEALRESEERFRTIFENSSSAMAIIEKDTTISMANREYCRIGLFEEKDVIGKSWTAQIPPEDLERLKGYNRQRLIDPKKAPDHYEFTFYRKDGKIRHSLMSVAVIPTSQNIVCSFLDITDRKQAEEERERLITELQSAIEHIKTLRGIIPICASCKKIRDDKGYWQQVEAYVSRHTEAQFSHGVCPDCMKKLYPEFCEDKETDSKK